MGKARLKVMAVIFSVMVLSIGLLMKSNNRVEDLEIRLKEAPAPIAVAKIPGDVVLSGCYMDGYGSIADLWADAHLIVKGQVMDQGEHEFGLSIISKVQAKAIYQGEVKDESLEVLQLKDGHGLEVGKDYVLFLREQEAAGDRIQYYVMGYGIQGIFQVNGKELLPKDEEMKLDFEKIKAQWMEEKGLEDLDDLQVLEAYFIKIRGF